MMSNTPDSSTEYDDWIIKPSFKTGDDVLITSKNNQRAKVLVACRSSSSEDYGYVVSIYLAGRDLWVTDGSCVYLDSELAPANPSKPFNPEVIS